MNQFVNAAVENATTTLTENGDVTYNTSLNACLDLFFQAGALRNSTENRITNVFGAAYAENPDLATRIALYGRDVRQGMGERKFFRTILQYLEKYDSERLMRVMPLVPVLGRWDDLFCVMNTDRTARGVLGLFCMALVRGDKLAAKWAPREKADRQLAARIKAYLGISRWEQYRKLVSHNSETVEQLMCAKRFGDINYSHVPSVASARYAKAFRRNDSERYTAYLNAVRAQTVDPSTGKIAKINTSVVYPYDVCKKGVDQVTADTMWNNLPDYVPEGMSFMPIVDVSGSMWSRVGGNVSCMDVSVSLGIYLAERNKSVFKDLIITFSSNPSFYKIKGKTLFEKYGNIERLDWGMSTNLDAAMQLIVDTAVKNSVPQSDMPTTLLVLSDMEFDNGSRYDVSTPASARVKQMFLDAGYKVPNIVWWNIQSRNGVVPIRANEHGMALVSGFSPQIVKNLLGGRLTPEQVMLDAVSSERYNH